MHLNAFLICSGAPQPISGGRSFSLYQSAEGPSSKPNACTHVMYTYTLQETYSAYTYERIWGHWDEELPLQIASLCKQLHSFSYNYGKAACHVCAMCVHVHIWKVYRDIAVEQP